MTSDGSELPPDELVEYCRTQSGLLSGSVQTMATQAADLLAEVDELIAELATVIDADSSTADPADIDSSTADPPDAGTESNDDVETDHRSAAQLEAEISRKQSIVAAKQARMRAFQDLAAAYETLADDLQSVDDGADALERVVTFEREHDAPAYLPDRETLLETVAGESEDS